MPTIDLIGFGVGTLSVVIAVAAAAIAINDGPFPVVGTARSALIALALIGIVGCAAGGIGNAPALGWTHPVVLIGTVLGVLAGAVIVAGLLGWTGLLSPVAGVIPPASAVPTAERLAIVALAGVMVFKWLLAAALLVTGALNR